jgi:Fe-S cluster assembly protein SufD
MNVVTREKTSKWREEFDLVAKTRSVSADVSDIQDKAIDAFSALGIPDKKLEDYKYTNIKLYLNEEFTSSAKETKLKKADIKGLFIEGHATFVMVNGWFVSELSQVDNLPKEVIAKGLFETISEKNKVAIANFDKQVEELSTPMAMLNTGLAQGGLFIHIPAKFHCKILIHILNISTSDKKALSNPRHLVYAEKSSECTLVETYYSVNNNGKSFTNSVTEIVLEENATLNNYVVQDEDNNASQHNIHEVSVARSGRFNSTVLTTNGSLVRNDLNVLLHGENCEIHLNGLFSLHGNNHVDNHTLVEHFAPNCFSNELYKGIMNDTSTGVFNGKIYVHQEAQKTNAYQSNKNVLLGEKSSINTKPQLEIYADDVKCTHGTSTGRLNEEALFYLQARGLSKDIARRVLLQAFANEVIDTIKDEALKSFVQQRAQGHIV